MAIDKNDEMHSYYVENHFYISDRFLFGVLDEFRYKNSAYRQYWFLETDSNKW